MREIIKKILPENCGILWKKKYTVVLVLNFFYILFFYFLMQLYS
ncbi:hypothetical protein [Flavobacterium sp. JP2137]